MNTWGNKIKLSIFGESHGPAIGIVIDGLPPGIELLEDFIQSEMARRAPGRSDISTPRSEADAVEILSGIFEGKTTGTPLCGMIRNTNTASKDYNRGILRPGHADYTGFVKYKGFADYRGGGHFSGRLTAPIVFAGAIAKIILREKGVVIGAHIERIKDIRDKCFDYVSVSENMLTGLTRKPFPVIDDAVTDSMKSVILEAKKNGDSVGGVIECAAINLPAGLGDPFFCSAESVISSMMFSIPAVKGIEFGSGFGLAEMTGSAANDELYAEGPTIHAYSNNNGGINGGITNGMPIIFSVAVKPTPSISCEQRTVDITKMENITAGTTGRHDPCIVHRAVPVVEAGLALCLLDLFCEG